MQHQYPFCVLYFSMDTDLLDVNVHPTKMELRFSNNEAIYKTLFEIIRGALTHKDFIPEVPVQEEKIRKRENIKAPLPEPFERRGVEMVRSGGRFQPQDIQQGTDGQSGFAASKENEDVQTTIPMQSAAPQKESSPPEIFLSLTRFFQRKKRLSQNSPRIGYRKAIHTPFPNPYRSQYRRIKQRQACQKRQRQLYRSQKSLTSNRNLRQSPKGF